MTIERLKSAIKNLPRINIIDRNQSPVVNVFDITYWQGVVGWSILPLFALAFWISLYAIYCCICRCHLCVLSEIADDMRIKSCQKIISVVLIAFYLISCCALALFVYASERLHSSLTTLQTVLGVANSNMTSLNATVGQVKHILSTQHKLLTTSGQGSETILKTLNLLQSSDLLRSVQDTTTLVSWTSHHLNKFEFIRWISIVAFTSKFALLTLLMFYQLSRKWKFSWSSLGMMFQTISAYALLTVFYIPMIMVSSDFCVHPREAFLKTMKCEGRDHRLRAFNDFYDCKNKYITLELNNLKGTIENVKLQLPQSILPSISRLISLISSLIDQADCKHTSQTARIVEQLICQPIFKYIFVCVVVNTVLCLTLPITAILLKSLTFYKRGRNGLAIQTPSRSLPAISTLTLSRIRKALRRNRHIDDNPSAPPINAGKPRGRRPSRRHHRSDHVSSLYPNANVQERLPMLPSRRTYLHKDSSPPPYPHTPDN